MRQLVLPAALLCLAACAHPQPAAAPVASPPTGANDLVFRLTELPGLMPPGASFRLPRLSLYGDGTLVLADTEPAILPQPTQRHLTPAGVRRVVQAAADAGLTSPTDYGTPQIADAGVSVFTVASTVTRVAAPTQNDGVTDSQRSARSRLKSFVDKLSDLDSFLGNDIEKSPQPYPYSSLAVFALPEPPNPGTNVRPWPLGDLAAAGEQHKAGRCLIVSGADLDKIRAAATAPASSPGPYTLWLSGNQLFHVLLRPLLRDEQSCQNLGD